jgi:hypothetical protein
LSTLQLPIFFGSLWAMAFFLLEGCDAT